MDIVKYNDPILREESKRFDFDNPPFDPIEFSQNLVSLMYGNNAICLTAQQVGVPYRIFAMRGSPENFVCFNPKIVTESEEKIKLEEISLTYPGLRVRITRSQHCRVRFATPNSDIRTETFTGMTARVFLQSCSNLDGIPFWSGISRLELSMALKKASKLGFSYLGNDFLRFCKDN